MSPRSFGCAQDDGFVVGLDIGGWVRSKHERSKKSQALLMTSKPGGKRVAHMTSKPGGKRVAHSSQKKVFSSMTSFTKCLQTSFTLRPESRVARNGLEGDGCTAAASRVCGGSGAWGGGF